MSLSAEQVDRARPFAEALLTLAEQAGRTDAVQEDLDSLAELAAQDVDFTRLLETALLEPRQKAESLAEIFRGRVDELTLRFMHVLCDHGATALLTTMPQAFREARDVLAGRVKVRAVTAAGLDEGDRQQLTVRLSQIIGHDVLLDETVDPGLIGGLVLRIGDTVFDGSVRQQLDQLRRQVIARGKNEIQGRRDLIAD